MIKMRAKSFINADDIVVLLSLQEQYYVDMINGNKKYEFRKKYKNAPTKAFIYISKTRKSIAALVEFGVPIVDKAEVIAQISENETPHSFQDMLDYLGENKTGYAIPVNNIIELNEISLDDLKGLIPNFTVPQSYYYVREGSELEIILKELECRVKNG